MAGIDTFDTHKDSRKHSPRLNDALEKNRTFLRNAVNGYEARNGSSFVWSVYSPPL